MMANRGGARNAISISVAPAVRILGRPYYDLPGIQELMRRLWEESVIDGFEFQNLAEWDATEPPRAEREQRLAAWDDSQRYTVEGIAALLRETGLPVLSVHANRDVGLCLCTGQTQDIERGRQLIHESLWLAGEVEAPVCVFHLWDTWAEDLAPQLLLDVLQEIAAQHPLVQAAVENIPTHLAGATPFDLVSRFEWITLDLRWAGLYDELGRFEAVKDRIVNVHLRGRLEQGRWLLRGAPFHFYEALETIRGRWGYAGPLTMEPHGLYGCAWEDLLSAMLSLRNGQGHTSGASTAASH